LRREATQIGERDGLMLALVTRLVLNRAGFAEALAHRLAGKLEDADLPAPVLTRLMLEIYDRNPAVLEAAVMDLLAVRERDPASPDLILVFLNLKGFHAVQASRVAHVLWRDDRQPLALVIQARAAEVFGVDIHPAARLGCGIMIDHGTGVVIGETAVVEDDVSLLQGVTLGGTGKERGDRHPKIRRGVLIGAGASVLGNIEVGHGAKVGAGSIVLDNVAPFTTVVGVPARSVGPRLTSVPAYTMDQTLPTPDYSI
jgi:serine O-acetyltransferase